MCVRGRGSKDSSACRLLCQTRIGAGSSFCPTTSSGRARRRAKTKRAGGSMLGMFCKSLAKCSRIAATILDCVYCSRRRSNRVRLGSVQQAMKPRIRHAPLRSSRSSTFAALLCASLSCYAAAAVDAEPRADEYHERLDIRPLDDGKVLSRFEFTTRSSNEAWQGLQYGDNDSMACTCECLNCYTWVALTRSHRSVSDDALAEVIDSYHTSIRCRGSPS